MRSKHESFAPLDESKGNYYQFPLCILAMSDEHHETLANIAAYSCDALAAALLSTCPDVISTEWGSLMSYAHVCGSFPSGFSLDEPDDDTDGNAALIVAASKLGYQFGSMQEFRQRIARSREFVRAFQLKHGKDTLVRLSPDRFQSAESETMTPPHFRVFCAILSFMPFGRDDRLVWIAPSRLIPRLLGYKSRAVMQAESGNERPLLLERSHVGRITAQLEQRGIVKGRITFRNRTYYSMRHTTEDLTRLVTQRMTGAKLIPLDFGRRAA